MTPTDPVVDVLGREAVPFWDRFDEANRAVLRPALRGVLEQVDAARQANVAPGTDSEQNTRMAAQLAEVRKLVEHHGGEWKSGDPALSVDNLVDAEREKAEGVRTRLAEALDVPLDDWRHVWPRAIDELVQATKDVVEQRKRLDEFNTAVRSLLADDVPPFLTLDEVVFHLREQLGRAKGDDVVDAEIIDADSQNYRAGYEAGRKPEIVTSAQAWAMPAGSWVLRCLNGERPWSGASPRPADAVGDKGDPRWLVLYRAPAPARPFAVGDVVTDPATLDLLPVETVLKLPGLRSAIRETDEDGCAPWRVSGWTDLVVSGALPSAAAIVHLPAVTS